MKPKHRDEAKRDSALLIVKALAKEPVFKPGEKDSSGELYPFGWLKFPADGYTLRQRARRFLSKRRAKGAKR